MIHLLVLLVAIAGFAGLLYGTPRHQLCLVGRTLPSRIGTRVRWAGWVLLVVSYAMAVLLLGGGYGTVEWAALLTVAALLSIVYLTLRTIAYEARR
ncbi:DUF3325 domain-containing protein [uncultured Sphingomonas sp.]|uniref:DUF3325 domain-containing protein n=1 Tax=uncultured Sphingomonas sp. TaxID=158754 RepID=UPI0025FF9C99|nr:DUF3325 domain-containing protein [uncultured Sphingomonas sp.]